MIRFLVWLWEQNPPRHGYDRARGAAKVNRWAAMMRAHVTRPHDLACVTDLREGIDGDVELIPLPRTFDALRVPGWTEKSGAPQCYRRLELLSPDAERLFGCDRLVSMDLDMIATANLDPIFDHGEPFKILKGTSPGRPYNGSLLEIRAGARSEIFEHFRKNPEQIAAQARKQYIGSDQGVLSLLLGPGAPTFGEADGVFCYAPRFTARFGFGRALTAPPSFLRLMFFPGNLKPWGEAGRRYAWIGNAWEGVERESRPLKRWIRIYRDPKGWGVGLAKSCQKLGLPCSLFVRPAAAPNGVAFVRLDQQGGQREISKGIVRDLAARGIATLPTAKEAEWYDDKVAQLPVLQRWLPPTVYTTDAAQAHATAQAIHAGTLEGIPRFPLISKSADSSASKGVRLIRDVDAAHEDVARAFGPGIPTAYGRRQTGYVYWQRFVEANPCDYRVCVIGSYVYGLVRDNRPGTPFASGSGIHRPLTLETPREVAAAELAVEIASQLSTNWLAFDVVFGADEVPYVLELSSAWTLKAYHECRLFTRRGFKPTNRTGADAFDVAAEALQSL